MTLSFLSKVLTITLSWNELSQAEQDNILLPFLEGRTWIEMPDFDLHISALHASIFWKPDPVDGVDPIEEST